MIQRYWLGFDDKHRWLAACCTVWAICWFCLPLIPDLQVILLLAGFLLDGHLHFTRCWRQD